MATAQLGGVTVNNPQQKANTSTGAPAKTVFSMHNAGQLAGHVLNALPGYSTLGSNITNPNVNYLGIPNPGAPSPTPTYNSGTNGATDGGSGGGTGSYSTVSQADPYAAYGGTAAYNNLVNDFANQKQNIYSTATDAANNAGVGLNGSILDYLNANTQGQRALDTKSIQNEQSRLSGVRGVQDMVGQGIRSGGVQLSNRNAGNSSATEALARAYALLGRQSLSQVGQQYAQGQQGIANDQQTFNENEVAGARKIADSKTQTINQIVADANNSLVNLDSRMAYANLPDRLALEQEKQNIKNQTLGLLSQYDQQLQSAQGAVHPMGQDQVQGQAFQNAAQGQAPDTAFAFDTAPAGQFQNTGPFASDLPLFTFPGNKKQA